MFGYLYRHLSLSACCLSFPVSSIMLLICSCIYLPLSLSLRILIYTLPSSSPVVIDPFVTIAYNYLFTHSVFYLPTSFCFSLPYLLYSRVYPYLTYLHTFLSGPLSLFILFLPLSTLSQLTEYHLTFLSQCLSAAHRVCLSVLD